MANPVATVAFIEGQAWAKAPDGSLRPLALGDTLAADEVLITASGARVELDFGEGEAVTIAGNQEVGLGPDLWEVSVTDPNEAQLADASIQQALTILEQGGDLLDELEETAAGGGDAGAGGGNSFVQVDRVAAAANENQSFNYGDPSLFRSSGGYGGQGFQNQPPVAENLQVTLDEDSETTGRVPALDPENDPLTFSLTTPPANGTLTLDPATGIFTYTPHPNYHGSDSFVVTVTDPRGNSSTSTVNLDITPVNDAPTAEDQTLETAEDTPVSGQVVAEDIDGDNLTYTLGTPPANGTVVIDPVTGEFTYTPNPDYHGNDTFVVTVDDGNGGTTTSTINLVVTPVNDAPVANDLSLLTDEDTPVDGQVPASDVDGDALTYQVSTPPTNGTVVLDPVTGQFTYTPNPDFNGSDSFVVTVDDGNGGTTTSTVTIGVLPVNDPPVSADLNLVTDENVPVGSQVVATDVDGDTLSYAVSTGPSNGTVTLNAVTGEFTYTPNTGYNGSDVFVVTVGDGNGGTTTSTVTIGVNPAGPVTPGNTAPVASDLALVTDEDTPVSGQVVASDADGDVLFYSVSSGPANGSLTFNSATGQFTYTPNVNYNGSDSFVVIVNDGNGGTTTSTVTIGVNPVNDAPVAEDLNLTTDEDTPVDGQIVASDVDGDDLTYTVSTSPANGTVDLDPDTGEFTYTPNADYNGSDSFVVTVSDGNGGTTTSTVTIGINPVNDAPVAEDLSLTTDEDTPVNGSINATDPEGDTLTYTVSTLPANGTVDLDSNTGEFTYTPNADYNGSDSFIVTVSDGNGGTTTSTVTIGVNPVNDAPVAEDLSLTTDEDTPVDGQIVASDVDGDDLTYTVSTSPTNGTVDLDPDTGEFTYTPNADYNGSDSFVVTVSDGNGGTTTSTVTIGVNPVNDAPVSEDLNLTTDEDTPVDGQIVASDVDGDTLSYTLTTIPANGTVDLDPDTGEFTYTPNADYNGSDSFVVTVSDGNGGTTTSTVTIGVNPVNDAPVAEDLSLTTDEDTPVDGQIVASDVDGDDLTYTVSTSPTNGTVDLDPDTGEFTYTPNADYNGSDSFVVTISDGNGGTTTSTVTIGVNPVNDAPVAEDLSLTTDEDTPVDGQIVASDADGDDLTYTVATSPTNGTVDLDPDTGEFTYTPNADYNGSDSFVVTISDGNGGTTTSTVTIGVNPVNDAPVAEDLSLTTDEDTPVDGQIVASDVDGDDLTYTVSTSPTNGTVDLDPDTGEFTYTPNANYNGSDSFVVTISDGNGGTTTSTVTIGINPVNDAPVAEDLNLTTDEDTPVDGQIVASDVDGDDLTYTVSTSPTNGTVDLDPDTGEFTYTPNADYNGSDSFVVTISDGNGGTTTSTVTIGINPVNDAPVAEDLNLTTDEDTPVDGQIVASDVDGDDLTYTVSTSPANGTVDLDPDTGEFTYTPNADYNGSDSFVVTVSDGNGGTTTSTVTIGVNPVNDAPVAEDLNLTTDEDTPVDGQIVASDVDGDDLTYTVSTSPTNGTVDLDPDTGEFTYTPNADYNGSDSFVVTVSDGNGGTTTSTVTIGVNPVNDAPVAEDLSLTTDEDTPVDGQIVASDVDGDTLSYTLTTIPANGTVDLDPDTGEFTYTPNADYNGSDSFVVTVSDGNGGTTTSTVTIGVNPVNDAPVAEDLSLTTDEDTPVDGQIVASDVDGDDLTYTVSTSPTNGTVDLDPDTGEFTYTPNADYNGSDSFVVTVSDGNGGTTTSTVTIGINPVNDAPVAENLNLTTAVDTPVDGQIVASDVDGDDLTYTVSTSPTNGTVDLDPDTGEFTYTPNAGYNGSDSFVVTVSDGNGGTATSTVTIGMQDVTAPDVVVNIVADLLLGGESSDVTFTFSEPVTGFTLDDLVVVGGVVTDLSAAVVNGDGSVTYTATFTADTDFSGPGSVAVTAGSYTDLSGNPGTGGSDTVSGNSSPIANDVSAVTFEDVLLSGNVLTDGTPDSDPDGDSISLVEFSVGSNTYVAGQTANIAGGTLTIGANGDYTFTPTANWSGSLPQVSYTISDGRGGFASANLNISVTPVADAPGLVIDGTSPSPVSTGLAFQGWENLDSGGDGDGIGVGDLIALINGAGAPTATGTLPVVSVDTGSGLEQYGAIKTSGLIYLEAGQTYTFGGFADDSGAILVGGQVVASGSWGVIGEDADGNSSDGLFSGTFTPTESGYYTLETYNHNQDGPGGYYYHVSVNGALSVLLGTGDFFIVSGVAELADQGLNVSNLQANGSGGHYRIYGLAEGETGTAIKLPGITSTLVDTDGSESLSVWIGSIPVGASLGDGVNTFTASAGNSEVDVSAWNLGNLSLTPASGFVGSLTLNVQAVTTEAGNGDQAITNSPLTVVVHPATGAAVTDGDQSLTVSGGAGNDVLTGGGNDDVIAGGAGNDILTGGLGADTFVWALGDAGVAGTPAEDTVTDFNTAEGDALSLGDLLQGENAANLDNYLFAVSDGTSTTLHISSTGGYAGGVYDASQTDQVILLQNVNLTGTSDEIINQLKTAGNLLTD